MLSRASSVVREMFNGVFYDVSRSAAEWWDGAVRVRRFIGSFSVFRRPRELDTTFNYELGRRLYRNEEPGLKYGGAFARPIVDLLIDYVGTPTVTTDVPEDDELLNRAIGDYWATSLVEAMRNCVRDSKVVIRFSQPKLTNRLVTATDRSYGCVEALPPETVDIVYDPADKTLIQMASVQHWVMVDDRTEQDLVDGKPPRMREHHIVETITPATISFFDKTTSEPLPDWGGPNQFGFVALWEGYNEYDSSLGGGISDLEPVLPLLKAFDDVMKQMLMAHSYQSTPILKLSVKSVDQFVRNNYPTAWDSEKGRIRDGATIDWNGESIMFFAPEEDGDFIQAKSVLGDSKALLSFLVELICVASESPSWGLNSSDENTSESTAGVTRFKKRVERKQKMFEPLVVMACKMVLVANSRDPNTPRVIWAPVEVEDLVAKGQAIQQLIMGFDVATANGWIAARNVVRILKTLFPEIGEPDDEMELAEENVNYSIAAAAPAPASPTQSLQLPSPSSNGHVANGKQAVAQLTTTTPSRS